MTTSNIVILGGGQAGCETAVELRKQGFDGRVVIVGEEPQYPYKRPPLSKAYLAGTADAAALAVMRPENLEKVSIEVLRGVRAERIDRDARTVVLSDGQSLAYDKLILATGGRARPLPTPGADRANVFPLRTIADVDRIRPYCREGQRVCIVGGGFIGLEVAAVCRKLGLHVTVLEGLPRVLARVTVPEVSAFFERIHREAGVDLRTGVQIDRFDGEQEASEVVLADGERIATDFVVVGIGLLPNTELAEAAGLAVDNGIVVDAWARTNDPDILAAGDCSNFPSAFLGRRVRLESVQNAMEQARAAARTAVGKPEVYDPVPWFWSDQYDLKLQMVGLSAGFDRMVVRGDLDGRSFAAFYLKEGRLIAADTVGRPQDFMFARKLVAAAAVIDADALADEAVALKTLMPVPA